MRNWMFWALLSVLPFGATRATELNVRDFGAKGDGVADESVAFDRALAALRRAEPNSVLKLPAGAYYFPGDGRYDNGHFVIDGLENAVIEGEGEQTMLLFGNHRLKGLRAMRCRNVTFRDFKIKYSDNILAQGRVLAREGQFELTVAPDALTPEWPPHPQLKLVFFRPDGEYEHGIAYNQVASAEKGDDGSYRLRTEWPLAGSDPTGKVAVVMLRLDNSTAFNHDFSRDGTVERVTIVSGPAAAFSASICDNMQFISCRVVPETGFFASTAGDGVHVKNNRKGPRIVDCVFRGMFDDSVNISTLTAPVAKVEGRTVWVDRDLPYAPGDELLFQDGRTLVELGTGVVAAAAKREWNGKRIWAVTLKDPAPELPRTMEGMGGTLDGNDLPAVVVNRSIAGAGSLISGCDMSDHRARGILLRAPARIVNCRFRNLRGPAILLAPEVYWLESGDLRDIAIENNRFDGIGLTNIQVDAFGANHRRLPVEGTLIRNLRIRGNVFENFGIPSPENNRYGVHGRIINITNGENIVIEDNRIGAPHPAAAPTERITVPGSKNVTIKDNA